VIDVVEILQHWYAGRSNTDVAASVGVDRGTVRKYVAPAESEGLEPGGPPISRVEWLERVERWFPELVDARIRSLTYPEINGHRERIKDWLPKLAYPIRAGEHSQSAFAFGLILDWARIAGDEEMNALLSETARRLYARDRDCPLAYEPSGQDFLSPCLAEADLMRRVLGPAEYADWLESFLPGIPPDDRSVWLVPAIVTDRSDPKLAHLDGLNLSRAWMLEGVISGLPEEDPRLPSLRSAADQHRQRGLEGVTGEFYEGGHWLGSFATYLITGRGLPAP